eukprot:12880580-Prorocentrum_lima.AAC.1
MGFKPIPDWRSCFVHPRLKLFLVVYVDDFKMSGPKQNLQEGWKLIRTSQKGTQAQILDDPTNPDRYLGCKHIMTT